MKGKGMFWILTCALLLTTPAWAGGYTASNGTVTDNGTGLVWQQEDDGHTRKWEEAIFYCEDLSLANQTDWRLPNFKELKSITDASRYKPAIDPIFTGANSDYYWSSTHTQNNLVNSAFCVHFYDGYFREYNKGNYFYVRCVRGGQ